MNFLKTYLITTNSSLQTEHGEVVLQGVLVEVILDQDARNSGVHMVELSLWIGLHVVFAQSNQKIFGDQLVYIVSGGQDDVIVDQHTTRDELNG